jgi:capsular polysaccharide biosynthesis protein
MPFEGGNGHTATMAPGVARERIAPGTVVPAAPRLSVSQAVGRYWYLVLLFPALLLAGAIAYGTSRKPVYRAETRMSVGRIDVVAQATPGYVQATQSLASAYSRAATGEFIVRPAAKRLGMKPNDLAARLSATPIPDSSVVSLKADAPSAARAQAEANATAAVLMDYVSKLNSSEPDTVRLLARFRHSALVAGQADARRQQAASAYSRSDTAHNRLVLSQANALAATAELRRDTLSGLYQQSQQGGSSSAALAVLTSATGASSDRGSVLQKLAFIALIGGLTLGVGAAVLLANRVTRRSPGF